jgi:hypothetical protein
MKTGWIFYIGALLSAGQVGAIVVEHCDIATNAPSGSWNVDWSCVHKYKNSSAVAVGPNWLLTAAHVADDTASSTVVVDGTNYLQREVVFHLPQHDPAHANRADLALVRFDKVFPVWVPLFTGNFPVTPPSKKLNAVLIGYGRTGTVSTASYTESLSGNGVRRWGTQKIDGTDTKNYAIIDTSVTPPVTNVTYNTGIKMDFDLSNTVYEAGVGIYDSGGGTFVNDSGTWKLAGINTTRYTTDNTNFIGTFAVSVPAYAVWATNVMNAAGDLDGDGLPNYWEQQYGTISGLVASADSDTDTFTNYEEYLADTNPTNPVSFLRINSFLARDAQTVWFVGSTARQYQVFYTTNDLADAGGTWSMAHTNKIWGAGTNSWIAVTNQVPCAFYRLQAILP